MPGEALLLAIASIAAIIAGFTAVTAALTPPGGSWSQVHRIRQRAIVSTSFNVVFEALLPVIAFVWLADVRQAVVLSSAIVALYAGWIVVTRGRQLHPRRRPAHMGRPPAVRAGASPRSPGSR